MKLQTIRECLIDSVRDQDFAVAGISDEIPFLSSDEEQDKSGGASGPKAIKVQDKNTFVRPLVLSGGATGIELRFDPFNDASNPIGKDGSIVLLKNSNILHPSQVITSNDINQRPNEV